MRRATVAAAAVLVLLAGCGGDDGQTAAPRLSDEQPTDTTTTEAADETTTTEAPTTTTTAAARDQFTIGDRLTTARGNEGTAYSFEDHVAPPDQYTEPDPGHRFAVADIEACAHVPFEDDPNGPAFHFSSYDFVLELDDNSRVEPSYRQARTPAAPSFAEMYVGDCVRGWITFEIPDERRAVALRDNAAQPPLRWTIPEA